MYTANRLPNKPRARESKHVFLNTKLFLHNQSDQQVATAPNKIKGLRSFWNPRSQLPKRWEMLRGWGRFNAACMQLLTTLANQYSKKRCLTVSFSWQKQHFSLPCQLHFTKLSFVKITPLRRYHIKIFTFSGQHIWCKSISLFNRANF
jgi:hypothetical protein